VNRRALLKAGLAAGVVLSTWPLTRPTALWGGEAGQPRHGGILHVRGFDPPHFDHHLTSNFKTNGTLSFVHSTLVRHQVGPEVRPGTFPVEPHLAERWDIPNATTYIFHLRPGVKWHHKPPLNGRELVAEDVKFTFDRFRTEPGNPLRDLLASVERVEVVDRLTVQFLLKEPNVWLLDMLAQPAGMWIIAPEVVHHFGDLKQAESAIGTGPFVLEHYEPNVKTVFRRNPDYFRPGQPYVDGVGWSGWWSTTSRPGWPCTAPGNSTAAPWSFGPYASTIWRRSSRAIPTCSIRISKPTGVRCSPCAPITPRSMMSACGAPSPWPSIARRWWRPSPSGANRLRPFPRA